MHAAGRNSPKRTFQNNRSLAEDWGVIVTSYGSGAESGYNLGTAGYSYDVVLSLFLPLIEQYGKVIKVQNSIANVADAAQALRAEGLKPIHLTFLPFQDITVCEGIPNIVAPAWEFPDVPDHEFDGNPQNDWPATAHRCDMILVGGPFTETSLRRAGVRTPIRIVQIPTPIGYFELPPWSSDTVKLIQCPCRVYPNDGEAIPIRPPKSSPRRFSQVKPLRRATRAVERGVKHCTIGLFGESRYRQLSSSIKHRRQRKHTARRQIAKTLYVANHPDLELSGIVYTSIFNPGDGRKNWTDLLTAFLIALGEYEDATLIIKFVSSSLDEIYKVIKYYENIDILHRCRLVFIPEFLTKHQMIQLTEASTYYYQTTKAEGNCLPLMNFIAAGRPGVSPNHSAIADYFDDEIGFVIESHPEPAAWPHDQQLRLRTYWNRVVWPSIAQKLLESYRIAKTDPVKYRTMAKKGKERMRHWASEVEVSHRLLDSLSRVIEKPTSLISIHPSDESKITSGSNGQRLAR